MAIPGIGENGQIDWSALLGKVLSDKAPEGTEGNSSIVLDGDNVTISMVDPTSGESISRTLALPDVRPDSLAADVLTFLLDFAAQVDEMVDQLKVLAEELGEEEPAPTPADGGETPQKTTYTNSQQTLFSIYELINLMQEIAQKERDSAREIRLAELQSQTASIQNQAEHQRLAAVYGLVIGAVTTAVQGCMMVGTTVASVKGLQKTDQMGAGQNLKQAQTDVQTLKAAVESPEAANANLQKINGKSSVETRDNVAQRLAAVETAKDTYARNPTEQNKAAYKQALTDAVDRMDAEYGAAVETTRTAEAKYVDEHSLLHPVRNQRNYSAMGDAQKTQAARGAERSLLRAKVASYRASLEGEGETLTTELTEARTGSMAAAKALKSDKGYLLAASNPAANGAYQQLSQMIGTIGQSIAQMAEASETAKATEEQAKQKEEEQYRDETNQLFQQAQELINSVRSLLQAVIQAESQSVEQIIRA